MVKNMEKIMKMHEKINKKFKNGKWTVLLLANVKNSKKLFIFIKEIVKIKTKEMKF